MSNEQRIDLKFGANLKDFRRGISNIDSSLKQLSGGFGALPWMNFKNTLKKTRLWNEDFKR